MFWTKLVTLLSLTPLRLLNLHVPETTNTRERRKSLDGGGGTLVRTWSDDLLFSVYRITKVLFNCQSVEGIRLFESTNRRLESLSQIIFDRFRLSLTSHSIYVDKKFGTSKPHKIICRYLSNNTQSFSSPLPDQRLRFKKDLSKPYLLTDHRCIFEPYHLSHWWI